MKISTIGALSASILACTAFPISHAASISGQGTWETTLQGRDLDGNFSNGFEAYYDTVLDITWLADANYAYTSGYQTLNNGRMQWVAANAWSAGLDPYGSGITGWRLPTVMDTGISGCNFAYSGTDCGYNVDTATSEMASMFYNTLGNLAYYSTSGGDNQPGWGLTNTGSFSNVQSSHYWSATEYAPGIGNAWVFFFGDGGQDAGSKANGFYAWAVHAGDVGAATVPVPAAAWLFASGLLGLVGLSRKR